MMGGYRGKPAKRVVPWWAPPPYVRDLGAWKLAVAEATAITGETIPWHRWDERLGLLPAGLFRPPPSRPRPLEAITI